MSGDRSRAAESAAVAGNRNGAPRRLGEERAARILERAAALDATRSSEIEVDQLREAAVAAGISREAFDQAMAELPDDGIPGEPAPPRGAAPTGPLRVERTLGTADVAYYSELLSDLLGEEGRVTVAEGRIEWSDGALTASVTPARRGTTGSVALEGRLGRRLMAIVLSVLPLLVITFMIALADGFVAPAIFGILFALAAALIGTFLSDRRERRALRRKAERIRRQLQRLLTSGSDA